MKPIPKQITCLLLATAACGQISAQDLKVDFGSTTSAVELGWFGYQALNGDASSFTPQAYTAFGGGVGNIVITPSFGVPPVAGQNPRIVVRGGAGVDDLLYDWVGIDTRSARVGDPMTITISGIPAGVYRFRSYHYDGPVGNGGSNQTGAVALTLTHSGGVISDPNFDQGAGTASDPVTIFERLIDGGADVTLEIDALGDFSLLNAIEIIDIDSDGDGVDDLWEDEHFGDNSGTVEPSDLTSTDGTGDADSDGLNDLGEQTAGTDPNNVDTDDDGIEDGPETTGEENPWLAGVLRSPFTPGTDPAGDPTDPTLDDSDGDLLLDGEEISGETNAYVGTNPAGGPPGDPSDPNATDSDGDGFSDTDEVDGNVTDPEGGFWTLNPALADSDGDGVDDAVEVNNITQGWDPTVDDSAGDFDSDGLKTSDEVAAGTDPSNPDTDGDGRTDNEEVNGAVTSNPLLADTDGDLINDKVEVDNGTNPNDGASFPSVPHLQVDFGLSPNGPLELFYQSYVALHETNSLDSDPNPPGSGDPAGVDRLNEAYPAFATTVNMSISYPDLDRDFFPDEAALATVKQMFDRGVGAYEGTKSDLVRTWIGLDARQSSNANLTGDINTLRLQLDGVPAGTYLLRTYHHDTLNQFGAFGMVVTDSDSSAVLLSDRFRPTTSGGGNFADPGAGNGPETLRSTIEQVIRSNGADPIIIDFQKTEVGGVVEDFIVLNGFELIPEATDDGDEIPDSVEIAVFGNTSTADNTSANGDTDLLTDFDELLFGLNPTSSDTDGDGLADHLETGDGIAVSGAVTIVAFDRNPTTGELTLDWLPAGPSDIHAGTDADLAAGTFPVSVLTGVTPPQTFSLPVPLDTAPEVYLQIAGPPAATGTDPFSDDTDGDGLTDGDELNIYGSSPLSTDSDGDAYGDAWEVATGGDPADPLSGPDDDGDGYNNLRETNAGTDPNDAGSFPTPDPATSLFVDFDSLSFGGPSLQGGYQSYQATHEISAEFVTKAFDGFGLLSTDASAVTVTPDWPDTTDARVEQMYDRGAGNDAQWFGDQINMLTDWIGVDTRSGGGGNGNYDGVGYPGTVGPYTRMTLALGNLPAGTYNWTSFHHDTEHVWADFLVEVSTDGGASYGAVMGPFNMTQSSNNPNPAPGNRHHGYTTDGTLDPVDLPSTFTTSFTADGVNDVVLRFIPIVDTAVHRQIWVINAFHLVKQP